MSDHHIALTGVLAQSGLIPDEQRELLLQLVQELESSSWFGWFPGRPKRLRCAGEGPTFIRIPSSAWTVAYFSTPGAE